MVEVQNRIQRTVAEPLKQILLLNRWLTLFGTWAHAHALFTAPIVMMLNRRDL